MIRTVRLILGTLAFVMLFVFGMDWLLETTVAQGVLPHLDRWPGLKTLPLEGRLVFASAGLLLPMAVLSLSLAESALAKGIRVTSKGGAEVVLRPEAIERPVNRDVFAEVDTVLKVESEAFQSGSGAGVKLMLTISDRADVDETQLRVRETAERTLRRVTGGAEARDIKVVVRDVKPGARSGKGPAPKGDRPKRKALAAKS